MKGKITIEKKVLTASLQDQGRGSYAQHGVPRAGTVDETSAKTVNSILGNKEYDTVLEWALLGPTLHFSRPTNICLSHTSSATKLNNKAVRAKERIYVPADSNLHLGASSQVLYQYLAIKGGFISDKILGSQSGLAEYLNLDQAMLTYKAIPLRKFQVARPVFDLPRIKKDDLVRVVLVHPGPEYDLLSQDSIRNLKQYLSLSQNRDRMGIHINEKIPNAIDNLLSVPTIPGTIQLTAGGTMIILGKDCQTTGGYPRILSLSEASLAKLYQLPSGVKFRFEIIKQ